MKNKLFKFVTIFITATVVASPYSFAGTRHSEQRHVNDAFKKDFGRKVYLEKKLPKASIEDVYVIHFIIDGVNLETFNQALAGGRLPNIRRMFFEEGAVFKSGLSLFPSTSSTVYQSYATGLWPGHAGIPHIQRFDRNRLKLVDYLTVSDYDTINSDQINLRTLMNPKIADLNTPSNIFELLSGHPTAAVYSPFNKGAAKIAPSVPLRAFWAAYISGDEARVDQLAFAEINKLYGDNLEDIPRYSLVGLYSSDINGHRYGPASKEVFEILTQFDLYLAEFEKLLAKRGIHEKTYIVVSADHGMHSTGKLFRLRKALEAKGIHVKPNNPKDKGYTLVAADRGVSSTHLYVKHNDGFSPIQNASIIEKHPTLWGEKIDLKDIILKMDASELLIVRNGDRKARIFGREGKTADVECYTVNYVDYCSYNFDELLGDPLGYSSAENLRQFLDKEPHSTFEWRAKTAELEYPDLIMAIGTMFEDGRAGDMFLTVRDGYGFKKIKAGGHGGPKIEDMRTPFMIRGPKIPRGEACVIRPVDLFPMMTKWFGIDVPSKNHDGVDPFAKHEPEDKIAVKLSALESLLEKYPPISKMIGVQDFVLTKVYPLIDPKDFDAIAKKAWDELGRRHELSKKLKAALDNMNKQKLRDDAPKVVDPDYLDDHISIVSRALERTRAGMVELEDILIILKSCKSIDSVACQGI